MKKQREYKMADGTYVPLFEADYDTSFPVYRSDRRKAVLGDPRKCIEALGLCRMHKALEAFIGTGKDAYVVFSASANRPFKHALHFTIPAQAAKVRDTFDKRGAPKTQHLTLRAPTKGRTLEHRSFLGKRLAAKIKNGEHVVKPRGKLNTPRITRIGAPHRPHAQIRSVSV